jgi:uncharacterized protein (TIGR03435 family)
MAWRWISERRSILIMVRGLLAVGLFRGGVTGQEVRQVNRPEVKRFEVVSLKPFGPRRGLGSTRVEDDRHVILSPIVPFNLLLRAYKLPWYQVVAPSWMKEARYSLNATLPDGASKADIPAMLQDLLTDRFHLSVHRELRETPVYALTVAESQHKLQPCEEEKCPPNQSYSTANTIRAQASTAGQLAFYLSGASDRPIIDRTNLTGHFVIVVEGTRPGLIPPESNTLPTIFSALRKLGFKLEPRRQPVEFLVVDGGTPASDGN